MSEELDLCPLCKYNSDCFGANGIGPCSLKDELTYKEELEKQVIHLQNREKALDEIIEKGNKFHELCTPCCTMNYTKFGVLIYDILKKYNLVKQNNYEHRRQNQ